jgi:hypothetical protein
VFERWNWEEPEHVDQFRGEPFLAIDPGEHGKVLGYEKGKPNPVLVAHPLQPEDLVRLMRSTGARVIVVEKQYVTMITHARSVLELTLKLGMCLGWVAATRANVQELHVFEMAASSWQAHQRGHVGRTPKRKESIRIMTERATAQATIDPVFRLWWAAETNSQGREGLASALGIADLWKHVAW